MSYGCSVLANNTFYITATPGERIDIKLGDIFRDKNKKQFTLSPLSEFFSISAPLSLIQQSQYNFQEPREVIAQKLYKSSGYLDITNQITILSKAQNKYFIEYNSVMFENTPEIDVVQQVNLKDASICYDALQVNQLYVIECNNVEGDYFALLNKDQVKFMTIINSQRQQRKLDQLDNLVLRNLYYSLELYQLQDNELVLLSTLDKEQVKKITKDENIDLLILDFKFHTNQQITILNQNGQFICLKYMIQQKQWELYEFLQTPTFLPYAYDYSWKYQQLVIISEKDIYLRQISAWTQQEDLNFKQTSRVSLSQNNIIIQNQKSLQILNLNLKERQSVDIKNQGFLNSYPAADQFLLFDLQNFYAYTINHEGDQILRFQSNQLINEDQLLNIYQHTSYNLCLVWCYYKVVEKASKDIYQQLTVTNSFFKGGFVLDQQSQLQFTQPFAGQNIKIEFTPNEFGTVSFSRSKKVEILNAGDPKDVIYRKIIPEAGQTSFIEQDKDLKITGYLCSLADKQFQCRTFIKTHEFVKLQDSPLQTWFAKFYTYLAIGKEKNVELYCNCNDLFQISLLTTLTLNSNIKEIKQSLSYLLIMVDQEVLVYQIIIGKQRLVFRHSAEKIFTSANSDRIWIYEKKTLNLFDISDNSKLLWFTSLKDYEDVEIGVSENHFLLLTKRDTQYQAFVYDYQSLKHAYITKELDLSGYTQLKLCLGCNSNSNFIYLEAQKNEDRVLLVYRLDQIAINSQFIEYSILASSQISSNEQTLFITNANFQMLSQYIIQKDSSSISIEVDKKYKQIKNCEIIKLNAKVFNSEKTQEIKELPISVINRGIDLFVVENEFNFKYEKAGENGHCFDLGQSWYSGQALDIDLKQPSGDVQLQKTLVKQENSIEYSESIMQFDDQNLIQLFKNKIVLVSKADFKTTEFELDNKYSFINVLYIQKDLIYVQATQNQQYHLKIIQYKDSKFSLLTGSITFNAQIKKVSQLNKYFFIWVDLKVQIYNTNDELSNLQKYAFVQNISIPPYDGSMEILYVQSNDVYQILFLNESCLLLLQSFQITQTQNGPYQSLIDIRNVLSEKLLYDPQNQICRNSFFANNELVVVISGTPSYKFGLVTKCQEQNICDIIELNLISEYQQYGDSVIDTKYPSSYLNENILSIIYQLDDGYDVLLYDLKSQNNKIGPKLAIAHFLSKSKQRPTISFVYSSNEQLHLLTSVDNEVKLQHYILRRSPQICTEKDSVTQNVIFLLKNYYQESTINVLVKISPNMPPNPPGPDPDSDVKKGFPLWATLTIIGCVILLGGIGITIWYCKKKKVSDDQYETIP
ncbi:unnamed protein product (macronuclear) [Paramecium tetraurelia]|uniref:Transmembrane protein n=1 Tax=Paramecium tetraurelia TaxID=5888 RepID=A0DLT5_PARTE|nr:uncharacterized protein GSPATT00039634001 [Paramecium tetraurelia]CAK84002.1 unnamed protein product [Paramecium tetraurelia]|eukprot:XP_001451399.1 hypothetical protein (macronuclear) [Paramecium tetraurelia strain d4-2]